MLDTTEIPGLLRELRSAGVRVVTVESCTGGLVSRLITSVPGASDIFWGALVTYDESSKRKLAGVSDMLLKKEGAVSAAVACQLALGGARIAVQALQGPSSVFPRVLAVSVTGLAGPSGGSIRLPIGTAYLGWADFHPSAKRHGYRKIEFPASTPRVELQERFAESALILLRQVLEGSAPTSDPPRAGF